MGCRNPLRFDVRVARKSSGFSGCGNNFAPSGRHRPFSSSGWSSFSARSIWADACLHRRTRRRPAPRIKPPPRIKVKIRATRLRLQPLRTRPRHKAVARSNLPSKSLSRARHLLSHRPGRTIPRRPRRQSRKQPRRRRHHPPRHRRLQPPHSPLMTTWQRATPRRRTQRPDNHLSHPPPTLRRLPPMPHRPRRINSRSRAMPRQAVWSSGSARPAIPSSPARTCSALRWPASSAARQVRRLASIIHLR